MSLWGLDNSLTARMERVPTRVTFPYVHSATTGVLEAALGELESIAPECTVLPWAVRLTHQRSACTIFVADSSDGMSKGVDNTVSSPLRPRTSPCLVLVPGDVVEWAMAAADGAGAAAELAASVLAGPVTVLSPAISASLPPALEHLNAPRHAAELPGTTLATTAFVRMTPDILTGLLVSFFLIGMLLIALQCLLNVRSPAKFVHEPLPPGKEF